MALVLGLEGLQPQAETTPVVELSDVLAAQIEFQDAYQAFIDYKNVCEIVFKAKASTENMAFASDLLAVSVEEVQVSKKTFGEKFNEAWGRFCDMFTTFFGWIGNALKEFANLFLKKADGTFKIGVKMQADELESIANAMEEVAKNPEVAGRNLAGIKATRGVMNNAEVGAYLTTNKQVKEWCKKAALAVTRIKAAIKAIGKVAGEKTFSACKRIMVIGSKVVRDLQATIKTVKGQTKRFDTSKKEEAAKQPEEAAK